MEKQEPFLEPLLQRTEAFGKSSIELLKLKTIQKLADVATSIVDQAIFIIIIIFFLFAVNIAFALWIGTILGAMYFGFFIVAGIYGVLAIVYILIRKKVKVQINDKIISNAFNV